MRLYAGGSGGLLAAAGALVAAAGLAFNARRASPKTSAPSPNKIKAKVKVFCFVPCNNCPPQHYITFFCCIKFVVSLASCNEL